MSISIYGFSQILFPISPLVQITNLSLFPEDKNPAHFYCQKLFLKLYFIFQFFRIANRLQTCASSGFTHRAGYTVFHRYCVVLNLIYFFFLFFNHAMENRAGAGVVSGLHQGP
jgi:hypothetical protein